MFGNLAERLALGGKLSQLKMSIGSCDMHKSKFLEDWSTCTDTNEESSHVSDTNVIECENSVEFDYYTMFEDDSSIDEIMIAIIT